VQVPKMGGSSLTDLNTTSSPSSSAKAGYNNNASELLNNFSFLNDLKDYIKSENPGAHRLVDFILTDKECTSRFLKSAFGKDDANQSLLLNNELNVSKEWIASAIDASGTVLFPPLYCIELTLLVYLLGLKV